MPNSSNSNKNFFFSIPDLMILEVNTNMPKKKDNNEDLVEQKNDMEERKVDKTAVCFRVQPKHDWTYDKNSGEWMLEVILPGVNKEALKIKVLDEVFDLKAIYEDTEYCLTEYFPFAIKMDSIDAQYCEGLLKIKGKIKDPLEDAIEVPVS